MGSNTFQSTAYLQNGNIGLVWIAAHADLDLGGFRIPVGWFGSIDPLASIVFVPLLLGWWRRHSSGELSRIATGAVLTAVANLLLAWASRDGGRVSPLYPLAYEALLGLAFLFNWPTVLALVSRAAPAGITSTMLGCAFLSLFVAGLAIGSLGAAYERMAPATFWLSNAAIAAAGAVLALVARRPVGTVLDHAEAGLVDAGAR